MKANKALKRLAKIKELISDVTKRYSASAPHLRNVLQNAEDAVARAKAAVGLHVPSKAKGRKKSATVAKKGQKKGAVKRVVNAPTAKTAKKSMPLRKAAKKRVAKKTAPSVVGESTPTKAAVQ